MTKIYPQQSPWDFYCLVESSYSNGNENSFLQNHLSNYVFLESHEIKSWKFDLYKDPNGMLIVAFRGSDSLTNWFHNIHQHFLDPIDTFKKMEEKICTWEQKHDGEIYATTGHSAGGLFAQRIFKDRDLFRVTFNGQKGKRGEKSIHLMLEGDPVSRYTSITERYLCIGEGTHSIKNFQKILKDKSWKNLEDIAHEWGKQKRVFSVNNVSLNFLTSIGETYLEYTHNHPNKDANKILKKIFKSPGSIAIKTVKKLMLRDSENPSLQNSLFTAAFLIAEAGEKKGIKSFKDPEFIKEIIHLGMDNIQVKTQNKPSGTQEGILSFVESFLKTFGDKNKFTVEHILEQQIPEDKTEIRNINQLIQEAGGLLKIFSQDIDQIEMGEIVSRLAKMIHSGLGEDDNQTLEKHFNKIDESHKKHLDIMKFRRGLSVGTPSRLALEQFLHTQLNCTDKIMQTLYEIHLVEKCYTEDVEQLRSKINSFKQASDEIESKVDALSEHESQIRVYYLKKIKHVNKVSTLLAKLQKDFGTGLKVLAAISCNPTVYSAAIGAEALGTIAQKNLSNKADAHVEKYQKALEKSKLIHEKANQLSAYYQDLIHSHQAQKKHLNDSLLDNRMNFSPESYRKELNDSLKDAETACESSEKIKQERQKVLDDCEKKLKIAKAYPKGKKWEHELKIKELEIERDHAQALLDSSQTQLINNQNERDRIQEELEKEEYLKPIVNAVWKQIEKELDKWESNGGDESSDKKDRQIREEFQSRFEQYHLARSRERELMNMGFQAFGELGKELDFALGTQKISMSIQFLCQSYRVYDLSKYFIDHAIPKWNAFYNEYTHKGFLDAINTIGVSTMVKELAFPTLQFISATMFAFRMVKGVFGCPTLTPEQKFLVDTLENGFDQFRKFMDSRFEGLKNYLDTHYDQAQKNHDENLEQFHFLLENISCSHKELVNEIEGGNGTILNAIHEQNYNKVISTNKKRAEKLSNKLDAFMIECINNSEDLYTNSKAFEVILQKYIGLVKSHLQNITADYKNGYHLGHPEEAGVSSLPIPFYIVHPNLLQRNPDHFTGLIERKLNNKENVPNAFLYTLLCKDFLKFSRSLICNRSILEFINKKSDLLRQLLRVKETLEIKGTSLLSMVNSVDIVVKNAKWHQIQLVSEIEKNVQMVENERKLRLKTSNFHAWELLKDIVSRLNSGEDIVGDGKFYLSNIVTQTPVKDDKIPLQFDSVDTDLEINDSTKDVKIGAGVGGALGLAIGGVGTVATGGAALPILVIVTGFFGLSSLGVGAAITTAYKGAKNGLAALGDRMFSDLTYKECYNASETLVSSKLNGTIQNIMDLPSVVVAERLKKNCKKIEGDRLSKVVLEAVYSLSEKCYKFRVSYMARRDPKRVITRFNRSNNERELIQFIINMDLSTQSYNVSFTPVSALKEIDVFNIQPSKIYNENYRKELSTLVQDYCNAIDFIVKEKEIRADNIFKGKVLPESELIPPMENGLLPLLFPREVLLDLYRNMQPELTYMFASGYSSLIPQYSFRLSKVSNTYKLKLHFKTNNNYDYVSFQLAEFDEITVRSFGKLHVTVSKGKENAEEYTFNETRTNLNEFLIQTMYSNLVTGLGMPGKGTHCVTTKDKEAFCAPVEYSFDGLWSIFQSYPEMQYVFDHSQYEGKSKIFLSQKERQEPGKDFLRIYHALRKEKQMHFEKMKKYQEAYNDVKTLANWLSQSTVDYLEGRMWKDLLLVAPCSIERMFEAVVLKGNTLTGDKDPDIAAFKAFLLNNPSNEFIQLKKLLQDLKPNLSPKSRMNTAELDK